ncbi:MAG TPA: hypothetical protein VD902_00755 [Symbiobacteriaceae bacterium]|nr:hypothetical protein [Symbiobacteriaceae bacterium]
MEELVAKAGHQITITGTTLAVVPEIKNSLRRRIETGCNLRLMAPDPEGNHFDAGCCMTNSDTETRRNVILANLHEIGTFVSELGQIQDRVEVRLLNQPMPAGYTTIDLDEPAGQIIVQRYMFDVAAEDAEFLTYIANRDGDWYVQQREHLEKLWSKAKPYSLRPHS